MKGVILNEFADFAQSAFATEGAVEDDVGAATWNANARYAADELGALIGRVSTSSGVAETDVLRRFGEYLFGRFAALYPTFFLEDASCLDFLAGIDTAIHGEVQKLYPDAEFPRFECRRSGDDRLELTYRSERGLADLAEGMLRGCIRYFREPITLDRANLPGGAGQCASFSLTRAAASPARRRRA